MQYNPELSSAEFGHHYQTDEMLARPRATARPDIEVVRAYGEWLKDKHAEGRRMRRRGEAEDELERAEDHYDEEMADMIRADANKILANNPPPDRMDYLFSHIRNMRTSGVPTVPRENTDWRDAHIPPRATQRPISPTEGMLNGGLVRSGPSARPQGYNIGQ